MSGHYDRYNGMDELLSTNLAEVGTDYISRQSAVDALNEYFARIGKLKRRGLTKGEKAISLDTVGAIKTLPPTEPQIIRCKDCKHWHSGSCEYPEHVVNSQDYYVGDIETEAEHFCGYAERREVTT